MPRSTLEQEAWAGEAHDDAADRAESATALKPVGSPEAQEHGEALAVPTKLDGHDLASVLIRAEEARVEALHSLARGVAHQLNNLLHGLLIQVELARRHVDRESPARESLEQVARSTAQGSEFVRQLLSFAGVTTGRFEECDVSRVVDGMRPRLTTMWPSRVHLQLSLGEELPAVLAEPLRIEQTTIALLENALTALEGRRGTIRVATGVALFTSRELATALPRAHVRAGRYVYLEISDDGIGMDAALVARVFEPFAVNKYTGKGLGLPLVLAAMRAWGGLVQLQTARDHGTCVRLLWPMLDPAMLPPAPKAQI